MSCPQQNEKQKESFSHHERAVVEGGVSRHRKNMGRRRDGRVSGVDGLKRIVPYENGRIECHRVLCCVR